MPIRTCIRELETSPQHGVLVLACSNLEMDLLPPLYEALSGMGDCRSLDVVFYSRGGVVNAARRIALLLRDFAPTVRFLVPFYCESSGTITALCADEIVAGPLAIFSPVDPLLAGGAGGNGPRSLSSQDLRLFGEMSANWFGLEPSEANAGALSVLCENIFPSTLTSFYRATLEVQAICEELLAFHLPDAAARKSIAEKLISGYHSHSYALTRDDLKALGLPVARDPRIEALIWPVAQALHANLGGGARASLEDDWMDALVATRHGVMARRRNGALSGRWQEWEAD